MKLKIKYIFLTGVLLGIFSLLTGCAVVSKKSFNLQQAHLTSIDQKIQKLDQSLSNLDIFTKNIVKLIEELSEKTTTIDKNYSKLQITLNELNSVVETKDSTLETALSDTQKTIENLKKKLSELEEAKADLQKQIAELRTEKHKIISSDVERPSEVVEGGGEVKVDASVSNQKETLQQLLDEAQELYRNENYKEAISKWEKAVAADPENLEAKLNIEIAKGKLKSLSEEKK